MDGYFKPNFKNEKRAIHSLELDDCEFVEDDELIVQQQSDHERTCPRCRAIIRTGVKYPYCLDCNWDSLTDPVFGIEQCAA